MKKRFLILLAFLWMIHNAQAACLFADKLWAEKSYELALANYEKCVYEDNDAVAQYTLATYYLDGTDFLEQDVRHALFLLRLSAENGYAPAQSKLAEVMDVLSTLGDVGVDALQEWKAQMRSMGFSDNVSAFAWAILAAEKTENKWFYPNAGPVDKNANALVETWTAQKGQVARTEAMRQAAAWKENRLLQSAHQILSDEAYANFYQIMTTSEKGQTIRSLRRQAMEDLKSVWEQQKK